MFEEDIFEKHLDYPEVLISGKGIKTRFWRGISPWSTGSLGGNAPSPIPSGRVELPLRVDPDFVPVPEFDVLTHERRELSDEEITEDMNRVEEEMGSVSPQFFLRNIGRSSLEVDEETLEKTTVDLELGQIYESSLQEAREQRGLSLRYVPEESGASLIFAEQVRLIRDVLFDANWSALFGREAKERSSVPLWAYFPDREAVELYGGSGFREFVESEAGEETTQEEKSPSS